MQKIWLGSVTWSAWALAMALFCAPVAMAATDSAQGETSGPAAGTVTKPSTAVQKQAANPGGMAAGAPGVTGKSGGEFGPQPKGSSEQTGKH